MLRVTRSEHIGPELVDGEVALRRFLGIAAADAQAAGLLDLVTIEAENGNVLSVVVGGAESVLTFVSSVDPPYFASSGPNPAVHPVLTCFLGLQHHTEFPRCQVIAISDALRAADEFARSGTRPTCVEWVEV